MSTTRLVCLANSWKLHERCIAGIELKSGEWVRPVSRLPHGEIPALQTHVGGRAARVLDVLDVPLDRTGPDFGFERENRTILPGEWRLVERLKPREVLRYCEDGIPTLHNAYKYVARHILEGLPFDGRRTLQLIRVKQLPVSSSKRPSGNQKWEGSVSMKNGQTRLLAITDPAFCERLEQGYRPQGECLLTLSLSLPHTPPKWDGPQNPCWKLIAAVIEL